MDTIKNLLHKDKSDKEDEAGATGKLTGEGSHFGSDQPQYGAVPGVGISSFTENQTQSDNTGFGSTTAAHDAAAVAANTAVGAPTSSTGAPQVQRPDFGERLGDTTTTSAITGIGYGSGANFPSKPTDDIASVGSVKSGVQGVGGSNALAQDHPSGTAATAVVGTSGTSLVDRSIPPGNSAVIAEPYTVRSFPLGGSSTTTGAAAPTVTQNWPEGGATSTLDQGAISSTTGISGHHTTFTGERLDEAHASHQQGRSFNEPEVTLAGTGAPSSSTQHHTGRDAAVAGGVAGVAGAGAYEHEKHEHEKHDGEEKTRKSSGGFLGLGKHKDKDDSSKETTQEGEHHKDSKLEMLGFRHNDPAHFQHDGDNEHTAKEKYFGSPEKAASDPSASGVPETTHHHGERDAALVGGAAVAGTAAHEHEKHEHDEQGKQGGETGEKKQGLLGRLFHRDSPNKLHKDPPESQSGSAAHETFAQPGINHEQHIGVDGPIGRVGEVSGLVGSDARHTVTASEIPKDLEVKPAAVPQTLHERAEAAPQGVVIEPRTGLPMDIGKYGTGHGGTDGAKQIAGYEENVNASRLNERDELLQKAQEPTWDKIADQRSGAPDNPTALASKVHENTAPTQGQ